MSSNFFQIATPHCSFSPILKKLGTHDLCASVHKTVEHIFQNFASKIFSKFLNVILQITTPAVFFLILTKLDTHDLRASVQKTMEQIFEIQIFGEFLKFKVWPTAVERSRLSGLIWFYSSVQLFSM